MLVRTNSEMARSLECASCKQTCICQQRIAHICLHDISDICTCKYVDIYPDEHLTSHTSKAVVEVCCGGNHCISRTVCGDVYSWGWGDQGQLGRGSEGRGGPTGEMPALVPGVCANTPRKQEAACHPFYFILFFIFI